MRTFVVRLWVANDPELEAREPMHGVVEQVGGRATSFGSEEELLAFLRGDVPAPADPAPAVEGRPA